MLKPLRIFQLLFVLLICGQLFSCKKSYTCECRNINNGGVGTTYTMDAYKRQAEEACATTLTAIHHADTTCDLK